MEVVCLSSDEVRRGFGNGDDVMNVMSNDSCGLQKENFK